MNRYLYILEFSDYTYLNIIKLHVALKVIHAVISEIILISSSIYSRLEYTKWNTAMNGQRAPVPKEKFASKTTLQKNGGYQPGSAIFQSSSL